MGSDDHLTSGESFAIIKLGIKRSVSKKNEIVVHKNIRILYKIAIFDFVSAFLYIGDFFN